MDNLHQSVDLIVQTVQQAQLNHLAIEFLTPEALYSTFADVKEAALANQATLMIEQAIWLKSPSRTCQTTTGP